VIDFNYSTLESTAATIFNALKILHYADNSV